MIENYRVEDISPNKSLLLLSTDVMGYSDENPFGLTDLYAIDVSQPNKKPLFLDRGGYFHAGAKWIDDHQVLFAGNDNHIISLYIINIDNLQKTLIFKPEVKQNIYRILYVNKKRIYWLDYFDKIWTANIDGTSSYILNIEQWVRGDNGSAIEDRCEVSPDGKWLAWQMDNWKGLQTISTVFFLYSLVDGSIVDIKEISQPRPEYPYTLLFSESNLVITPNSVNDYNGLYFKKIPIYVYNLSTKASSEVDVNYSDYEVMEGYDSYSLSSDGHLLIINSDIHITNNKTKLPSYIDVKIINLDNGKVYNFMVSDFRHVIWIK